MKNKTRYAIGALAISAAGLGGLLSYEGFRSTAYQPVEGDVWTIGYGTTKGVKEGDVITMEEALRRAREDLDAFQRDMGRCVHVPLTQYEFDAYLSFMYNVGSERFCTSTLVKKLNQYDYEGACKELKRWVYFKGKKLPGLERRRNDEYQRCIGAKP